MARGAFREEARGVGDDRIGGVHEPLEVVRDAEGEPSLGDSHAGRGGRRGSSGKGSRRDGLLGRVVRGAGRVRGLVGGCPERGSRPSSRSPTMRCERLLSSGSMVGAVSAGRAACAWWRSNPSHGECGATLLYTLPTQTQATPLPDDPDSPLPVPEVTSTKVGKPRSIRKQRCPYRTMAACRCGGKPFLCSLDVEEPEDRPVKVSVSDCVKCGKAGKNK